MPYYKLLDTRSFQCNVVLFLRLCWKKYRSQFGRKWWIRLLDWSRHLRFLLRLHHHSISVFSTKLRVIFIHRRLQIVEYEIVPNRCLACVRNYKLGSFSTNQVVFRTALFVEMWILPSDVHQLISPRRLRVSRVSRWKDTRYPHDEFQQDTGYALSEFRFSLLSSTGKNSRPRDTSRLAGRCRDR